MFRQDRTNPSTAVSNWKGRKDSKKGHPSTAVSTWLNGGLFGVPFVYAEAAYFAGGLNFGATIDKFAFSDDSRITSPATLSTGGFGMQGAANSGVAAYIAGGSRSGVVTTVDKIDFSDDSRTTLGTGLSGAVERLAGAANSGTAAYFAGGNT